MSDSIDDEEKKPGRISFAMTIFHQVRQYLVLGVFLYFGYRWMGRSEDRWADKPQPAHTPSAVTPSAAAPHAGPLPQIVPDDAVTKTTTDLIQQQELRMVTDILRRLYAQQLEDLKKLTSDLEQDMNNWVNYKRLMLATDQGKPIAGDPEAMSRFKALLEEDVPGKEVLDRVRLAMPALKAPMELAAAHALTTWSPGPAQELLDDLTKRTRDARNSNRSALEAAQSLLKMAIRNGKTSDLLLQDAMERMNTEQTIKHALDLKKVHEDAVAKREAGELQTAKENERKAAISRDPEALRLLDFVGFGGNNKKIFAASAAKAYAEIGYFDTQATIIVAMARGTFVNGDYHRDAVEELQRRNKLAQGRFGMSLHQLFRTVLDSKANQDILPDNDHLRREIDQAQNNGDQRRAADLAGLLRENNTLPAPKYP